MAKMMEFHLAKYGEELLMEGVGLDAREYETIKATLPQETQVRLFGWRNLALLPYRKGETFNPNPLDVTRLSASSRVAAGGAI